MRFGIKGLAFLQVWLVLVGVFAFGFFMSEIELVGAADGSTQTDIITGTGSTDGVSGSGVTDLPNFDPSTFGDTPSTDGVSGSGVTDLPNFDPSTFGNTPNFGNDVIGKVAVASTISPMLSLNKKYSKNDNIIGQLNSEFGDLDKSEAALRDTTGKVVGKNTDSWLANFFGVGKGSVKSGLLTGLQYATIAYGSGYLIGGMLGMSDDNTKALSSALAAGTFAYQFLETYKFAKVPGSVFAKGGGLEWIGANPGLTSVGIGVVVFALMYKETETKIVTFDCMPWQAPSGGSNCEVCNEDDLPCSEYRCKSLGAGCEIVNAGTEEEKCVGADPRDVNPPIITPNEEFLTNGYNYQNVKTSPPGPGFEIVNTKSGNGCIGAFNTISFGVTLDEPGQCKIDYNSTEKFDDMISFMGGNNLYSYNHSDVFSLPEIENLEGSGLTLENGKDLTFFIRCKDVNGNENEAEYAINFCVDPTPDSTPPKIEATSVVNNGCIASDIDTADVIFYVNEPSDCKWDFEDRNYDMMDNSMSCSNNVWQANAAQLYECKAELTGISRVTSNYYIKCKDQPNVEEANRNENRESFVFTLTGSTTLVMRKLLPNGTIFGGVSPAPIELYVETLFGCEEGQSTCAYSSDGKNYIEFFDTDNADGISTQRLDLVDGSYEYFIRCVDSGGNLVENSTKFTIDIDKSAPVIARAYEEDDMLKIVTVKESECAYTHNNCDFVFDEGTAMPYANSTNHVAEWDESKTYYIKCRDEYQNEDNDCSIIIRPSMNFL